MSAGPERPPGGRVPASRVRGVAGRSAAWLLCAAIAGASLPARAEPGAAPVPGAERSTGLARRQAEVTQHLARCWERPDAGRGRDWLALGVLFGIAAGLEFGADAPRAARWSGRNDFDDAIRSGLQASSRRGRDRAATASGAITGVIGAGLVGGWLLDCGRESEDERRGLMWSVRNDGAWLAASLAFTRATKVAAGRARPYVRPCATDPGWVSACDSGRDDNASFFSGHTATASTMAGLLCARHLGGPVVTASDVAWCGLPVAGALATGLLRIASDEHHATDVIAGWVSGALFGYLLPRELVYDGSRRGAALRPLGTVEGTGLELVVTF